MRIAVLTWSRRRIAGTESYVATATQALQAAGHSVALVSESDQPFDRELIAPEPISSWCVARLGREQVLAELRMWKPDVLYGHGFHDPGFEGSTLEIAPAAFFVHEFRGTCISGAKTFKAPVVRPCDRHFGWPCLLHYYPHRCGGLNPFTMVQDYQRQGNRLKLLLRYSAIITHSRRLESEYLKHGIPRDRLHRVPYCAEEPMRPVPRASKSTVFRQPERPHLVFLGRMTLLKGGHLLLRALPKIRAAMGTGLRVTFAGDGPERVRWESQARRLQARDPGLEIVFTGWLSPDQRDALLDQSDLLVVPSVWPEPLGLVGIEAARRGVPAAAYDVGGIPDWLESGVSGFLASGDPPTAGGLADAVVRCLQVPETLERLREGALQITQRHSVTVHMAQLEPILTSVAQLTGARPESHS